MTSSVPARILLPLRGQVVRRMPDESSSVSVTFTVENSGADATKALPFPVARHVLNASDGSPDEPRRHVLVEGEGRNHGFEAGLWSRHTSGSSSGYLAGAIAQEWPGVRLHNPQYQTAARLYRDIHSLGLRAPPPIRHSTKI